MTAIKTSDLIGAALDWAVGCAHGHQLDLSDPQDPWLIRDGIADQPLYRYTPSTDWSQGGPIIERERIDLLGMVYGPAGEWTASAPRKNLIGWRHIATGPTPLIAAMRCYVASKLGDTVDIPAELL